MLTLDRHPSKSDKSVLIVDDDMKFVKMVRDILQEEGYTVYCGFDGHMAVELAKAYHPDLILMDVGMPMMDGIQAFQRLRAVTETSRIPVIFLSGVVSEMIYPILKSAPRAGHLKKPLDLIELTSIARHYLQTYAA